MADEYDGFDGVGTFEALLECSLDEGVFDVDDEGIDLQKPARDQARKASPDD